MLAHSNLIIFIILKYNVKGIYRVNLIIVKRKKYNGVCHIAENISTLMWQKSWESSPTIIWCPGNAQAYIRWVLRFGMSVWIPNRLLMIRWCELVWMRYDSGCQLDGTFDISLSIISHVYQGYLSGIKSLCKKYNGWQWVIHCYVVAFLCCPILGKNRKLSFPTNKWL